MNVTLLDTKTQKTIEVKEDISPFSWAEGNWSCDCNRIMYFTDEECGEDDFCKGNERFLVVNFELTPEEFLECGDVYSIMDFNYGYPDDLIRKFINK